MAAIPEDLLIAILSILPTKSLHRFKCVSKLWANIITHISSQRTTLLPMTGLFFYQSPNVRPKELGDYDKDTEGFYTPTTHKFEDDQGFKSRLSRFPFYPKASLIDTCNGLFLFVDRNMIYNHQIKIYYVCNPATNEFVALPDPPINRRPPDSYLAFDPRVSPHYKVVFFTFNDQHSHVIVVMYSSMTGRWAMFTRRLTDFNSWRSEMVFRKRALYMITWQYELLIRFDTDQASFHATKLPGKQSSSIEKGHIGESRGRLYYAANDLYAASELRIYMLDEEGTEEWLLMHIVRTTKGIAPFFYGAKAFHPDLEVIYLSIPGKILSCNPSSGVLEEIWSLDGYVAHNIFPVIYCLESLNPPGGKFISSFAMDDK